MGGALANVIFLEVISVLLFNWHHGVLTLLVLLTMLRTFIKIVNRIQVLTFLILSVEIKY